MGEFLTTTAAAARLGAYPWQLRRLLDELEKAGEAKVPRIGRDRAVSVDLLPLLASELAVRTGWARPPVPAA